MKIVIAPDSFKESLSALAVADAIETGLRRVLPDAHIVKIPMADGGEGTVQSLIDATQGTLHTTEVSDPLGKRVAAFFWRVGRPTHRDCGNGSRFGFALGGFR